jgi:hypothetical protein
MNLTIPVICAESGIETKNLLPSQQSGSKLKMPTHEFDSKLTTNEIPLVPKGFLRVAKR